PSRRPARQWRPHDCLLRPARQPRAALRAPWEHRQRSTGVALERLANLCVHLFGGDALAALELIERIDQPLFLLGRQYGRLLALETTHELRSQARALLLGKTQRLFQELAARLTH